MSERESVARTLAFAAGVALLCSLLVSSVVYFLRPIQLAYSAVEQHRAVLIAAGLAEPGAGLSDREVGDRYLELEPRLVDLDAGEFAAADSSVIASYDYRTAADDPARSKSIDPAADVASLGQRPRLMPVYLLRGENGLERIVLTVYGQGMWSTIHAYLALEGDFSTIASIWFFEHGETPGIGDRIENPEWLDEWAGKQAYGADGTVRLRIGGSREVPESSRIDAITGATVTSTAVERLVRYWLGADGYGPFLATLRAQER